MAGARILATSPEKRDRLFYPRAGIRAALFAGSLIADPNLTRGNLPEADMTHAKLLVDICCDGDDDTKSNKSETFIAALKIVRRRKANWKKFVYRCDGVISRRFFMTRSSGHIGLGPALMEAQDRVCVLFGGPVPYVIRPTEMPGRYHFVGECYVHGMMEGQAVQLWERGELKAHRMEFC